MGVFGLIVYPNAVRMAACQVAGHEDINFRFLLLDSQEMIKIDLNWQQITIETLGFDE